MMLIVDERSRQRTVRAKMIMRRSRLARVEAKHSGGTLDPCSNYILLINVQWYLETNKSELSASNRYEIAY